MGRWPPPVLFELGVRLVHNELVKATLEIINQMQADGVISHYAIGGGVGAAYYLEPAATPDIDIFVILPFAPGAPQNNVGPLHDYLSPRGCTVKGEHVVIESWPVRSLFRATS